MQRALVVLMTLTASAALGQTRYEVENGALKVPSAVRFETGSDKLAAESDEALNYVKGFLDEKKDITLLRIEGHTDTDGSEAFNQNLSEKRALAIARWLAGKGVDCKRLLPVGFGGSKPVAPNDTPDNKAQNRRFVFAPAALRGHLIGGMPADGGGRVAGDPCP